MTTRTYRSFWFISGIVLFMLATYLFFCNSITALAAGPDSSNVAVTVSILPGPLTATLNDVSFVGQTTNGTATTSTYQLHLSVIDATGSGSGWNLALVNALPPSTTAMLTQISVVCASESACSLPQSNVTYPVMMQENSATANILNAGTNSGLGSFSITATLTITTPTSASVNSFDGNLALLVSGGTM